MKEMLGALFFMSATMLLAWATCFFISKAKLTEEAALKTQIAQLEHKVSTLESKEDEGCWLRVAYELQKEAEEGLRRVK